MYMRVAIQKAKTQKENLQVIRLDLANANGSVAHRCCGRPSRYCVFGEIKAMLKEYFPGFSLLFTTSTFTNKWIKLHVG